MTRRRGWGSGGWRTKQYEGGALEGLRGGGVGTSGDSASMYGPVGRVFPGAAGDPKGDAAEGSSAGMGLPAGGGDWKEHMGSKTMLHDARSSDEAFRAPSGGPRTREGGGAWGTPQAISGGAGERQPSGCW
jgi:hypothetical protein